MRLFGMRPLPVVAAVPAAPHLPDLDDQRRLIARARGDSRRWLLRCVLLLVVGALSVRRGWIILGVVFFALALLVLQLSRSTLKQAAELEKKLSLLEGK
jgi:hypothetical protein